MTKKDTYTAEQFIKAIPGSGGIISTIAKRVGCRWHTAKKYCLEYPTVKRVYDDEKEGILDLAEAKLIEAINDSDMGAIKFYLTTKGKDRGYVERQQIEVAMRKELESFMDDLETKLPPEIYDQVLSLYASPTEEA